MATKPSKNVKGVTVSGTVSGATVTPVKGSGYPEKNVKTSGVKTRGNGAATKGTIARGPMA